jgi:hypothetical protein
MDRLVKQCPAGQRRSVRRLLWPTGTPPKTDLRDLARQGISVWDYVKRHSVRV